jgi:predicted RNA-binding Zn ribbon-like protein
MRAHALVFPGRVRSPGERFRCFFPVSSTERSAGIRDRIGEMVYSGTAAAESAASVRGEVRNPDRLPAPHARATDELEAFLRQQLGAVLP